MTKQPNVCCGKFMDFCSETDNVIMGHAKINDVLYLTTFYDHYTRNFRYCPFCGNSYIPVTKEEKDE